MAHNARIRADLAAWSAYVPVDPAEFEALDQAQFESINGDDGGTWNPAAFITIGGSGLQLTGVGHTVAGTLSVGGIISVPYGGQITVEGDGASSSYQMIDFTEGAGMYLRGISTSVRAQWRLGTWGELYADTNGRIRLATGSSMLVDSGGQIDVNGHIDIQSGGYVTVESGGAVTTDSGSTLTLGGTNSLTTPMTCSGTGHVRHRTYEVTSDADETIYIADGDFVWMGTSTISAARTWILSTSGAVNGDTITLYNRSSTYAIHASLSGVSYDLQSGSSGRRTSITAEYFASQWRAIGEFILP